MTANKTKVPLVPSEVSLRGRIPRRCINQTKSIYSEDRISVMWRESDEKF